MLTPAKARGALLSISMRGRARTRRRRLVPDHHQRHRARGTGILNNEFYIGRLVWTARALFTGGVFFCDDRAGAEANLLSPLLACCCLADCGGTAGGMLIGSASQGPLPGTDRGRRAKATQPPPATLNSATGCPPSPWNRDNRKTVGFRALPLGQVCARGSRPHGDWHADLASRGTQSCGQLFRECYRML